MRRLVGAVLLLVLPLCGGITGRAAAATGPTALKTVSLAGFDISVPASWPVESASKCPSPKGSAVVTGTPAQLDECNLSASARSTIVEFGYGGPPPHPPNDGFTTADIHGIQSYEASASGGITGPELLATLDRWSNWLLFVGAAGNASTSLREARQILSTVRANRSLKIGVVAGRPVGHWEVHDGQLDVTSSTQATLDLWGGGCTSTPNLGCAVIATLALKQSADGSRFAATIEKVKAYETSKRYVMDPRSAELPQVGQKSVFLFTASQLMIELNNGSPPWSESGNPYWCSTRSPEPAWVQRVDYCGA